MEFWTSLLNLLVPLATIGALIVGFREWQNSQIFARKLALAEDAIVAFMHAKDAFVIARSPFGFGGEGSSRKRSENETIEEQKFLDDAFVIVERLNKFADDFSKLYSLRHRFTYYFGTETDEHFKCIQNVHNDLLMSCHRKVRYARAYVEGLNATQRASLDKKIEENDKIFWSNEDGDELSKSVDQAVLSIETICSTLVRNRRIFWQG